MQWTTIRTNLCILSILLATAACKPQETEQEPSLNDPSNKVASAVSPIPKKDKTNTPLPTKTDPFADLDLQKTLCKDRPLCDIKRTWDAGLDDEQRPMHVVELTTNTEIFDRIKKDTNYFKQNDINESCNALEYWLILPTLLRDKASKTQPDAKPVLLLNGCGGAIFSDGFLENDVDVKPSQFHYWSKKSNSKNDITFKRFTIHLPSLQTIQFADHYARAEYPGIPSYRSWDSIKFAGHQYGFNHTCNPNVANHDEATIASFKQPNYDYQPIIVADLPESFRNGGWKKTPLGTCSTTVTSLGNNRRDPHNPTLDTGYVTHGQPGTHKDASFKVIMASNTEIYVEVTDHTLIQNAPKILHTDHLELWIRTGIVCPTPNKNLFQWGITLDGKVHPFYGKHPHPPTSKSVIIQNPNGTQTVRFQIHIPEPYEALTIVYSDSDDGKSQKRLIATSDLKFKDQFSLGDKEYLQHHEGTCHTNDNALDFQLDPIDARRTESPVIEYPY